MKSYQIDLAESQTNSSKTGYNIQLRKNYKAMLNSFLIGL